MKWLLLLPFALALLPVQAASILFKEGTPSLLKEKVEGAMSLLPSQYLESAKGKIEIEAAALSGDKYIGEDLCSLHEKSIFAQTRKKGKNHKIKISSRLLQLAASVSREQDCSHGSWDRVLTAAVIHELTHVKDNFEKISVEPDFQRIVGVKRLQKTGKKRLMNQNVSASPDAYEFTNLEEALAVNAEYLVLDPEFECRRPATANFLSRHLGIPLPGTCSKSHQVVTQSAYVEDNYQQAVSIDPSRVYQVHYLFAGKGRALMSRWGHAMFRLVICAPHRKEPGPDCLKDVSHHLALSYRAYMSGVNINYMKGLSGGYPSQLFILRFHEVQQEYTKFELRDLYSLPLRLTDRQKKDFLDLTLERFWTYQGKYYFIDNNCGTEAQKHLAAALDEDQSRLIRSITPLRIYKDIISHGEKLAQQDLQDLKREELISRSLLIEGLYKELEETYLYLRTTGLFSEKKFGKFLEKTRAPKRLSAYEDFFHDLRTGEAEKKKMIMRLIYLERYLSGRFLLELPKRAIEKMNKDPVLKDQVMKMGEGLKLLATQPWEVVSSSYGVPTAKEFEEQWPLFLDARAKAASGSAEKQLNELQSMLQRSDFQQELEELQALKAIKVMTNNFLLKIHGL